MSDSLMAWLAFVSIGLLVAAALFALLYLCGILTGKKEK
jgi:hypothetical protein